MLTLIPETNLYVDPSSVDLVACDYDSSTQSYDVVIYFKSGNRIVAQSFNSRTRNSNDAYVEAERMVDTVAEYINNALSDKK